MPRIDYKPGLFEYEAFELKHKQDQRRKKADINPNITAKRQDRELARKNAEPHVVSKGFVWLMTLLVKGLSHMGSKFAYWVEARAIKWRSRR